MRTRSVLLLVASALIAASTTAHAQISLGSPSVAEHQAEPGESYTGTIVVRNSSNTPQEAKIYHTDYLSFANGTTSYGEPGTTPRSNAKWITVQPSYVSVPPHQAVEVTYTVHVPTHMARPLVGTYWSMLMVEGIPKGSAESRYASTAGQRKVQMGIVTRLRYAVQIVTDIGDTGTRTVQFANPKTVVDTHGKRLQFDLSNTGERAYRPRITLELYSETGDRVTTSAATRELIYPGTSLRQSFTLSRIPHGQYRALVIVDSGGDDAFGAQFTITL